MSTHSGLNLVRTRLTHVHYTHLSYQSQLNYLEEKMAMGKKINVENDALLNQNPIRYKPSKLAQIYELIQALKIYLTKWCIRVVFFLEIYAHVAVCNYSYQRKRIHSKKNKSMLVWTATYFERGMIWHLSAKNTPNTSMNNFHIPRITSKTKPLVVSALPQTSSVENGINKTRSPINTNSMY